MRVDKPLDVKEILENEVEKSRVINILGSLSLLIKDNKKGSLTIAINGDWGSGKTTILKALESFFRDHCGFPVIFFEAWRYQEEDNLLVPLIREIRDSLPKNSSRLKGDLTRFIKPFSVMGLNLSDLILKLSTGKTLDLKGIRDLFKEFEDIQEELKSKYKENLKRLERSIRKLREDKPERDQKYSKLWENGDMKLEEWKKDLNIFVLLIDDLDRLIPEKAFGMIEALRFYFDIDNVLIVMGLNDRILNAYVEKRYMLGEDTERKRERFLDKIFHTSYKLSSNPLNDLHLRGLKNSGLGDEKLSNLKTLLSNIDNLPHRKWVKFANRLEEKIYPKEEKRSIYEDVFSAFLEEFFPELELFLRRFPLLTKFLYDIPFGDSKSR